MGISILLTVLFGPLGMFYSTVPGAIIMMIASAIVGVITLGFGLLLTWPISIIWGAIATSSYNKNLVAGGAVRSDAPRAMSPDAHIPPVAVTPSVHQTPASPPVFATPSMTSVTTGRTIALVALVVIVGSVGALYFKGQSRVGDTADTSTGPQSPTAVTAARQTGSAVKPTNATRPGTKFVGSWDSEPTGMFRHYYNIQVRDGRFELSGPELRSFVPLEIAEGKLTGIWASHDLPAQRFTLEVMSDTELRYTFGGTTDTWIKAPPPERHVPTSETTRPTGQANSFANTPAEKATVSTLKINSEVGWPMVSFSSKDKSNAINEYILRHTWGTPDSTVSNLKATLEKDAQESLKSVEYKVVVNTSSRLLIDMTVCFGGAGIHCESTKLDFNLITGEKTVTK